MSDFSDKPGYAFSSDPPPEVSTWLASKSTRPSFSWEDVEPEEHAVAFTVAKATQADVLEAIRTEVQKAIDEGRTLDQFRKDLTPRLQQLGWWGRKDIEDPETGETVEAQLGSPRRLRTIYQANLRSARAAGQWDRIQRTKSALPYLRYGLSSSLDRRKEHVQKVGTILPADDPFWDHWFPPNGWNCKCTVRQITRREAERRGISERPEIPTIEHRNRRTGEVRQVPVGLDAAWSNNPGKYRMANIADHLAGRLESVDPAIAKVAAADVLNSWAFRRMQSGGDARRPDMPIAMIPAELASRIGARSRIVRFAQATANQQLADQPDVTAEDYARLPDLVDSGAAAVDGNQVTLTRQGPDDDAPWQAVLKAREDGRTVNLTRLSRAAN